MKFFIIVNKQTKGISIRKLIPFVCLFFVSNVYQNTSSCSKKIELIIKMNVGERMKGSEYIGYKI